MKQQSWPFSQIKLDAVETAEVDKLWHDFHATVTNAEGASYDIEAIMSAWQTIAEFILVDFIFNSQSDIPTNHF